MPPSTSQPHVLYVAWGFPPARSGGVYRALATANAFAREGFRVTVLTADRAVFERHTGADTSLEARIEPGIEVIRVPFSWPYPETDRSRWSLTRRLLPRVWWRARKLLDQAPFPEPVYGRWRGRLERAAASVHRRDPVDLVVATANPYVDFTAARSLYRSAAVPYVMDYRDAWLLDVFDGHQVHRDRSRQARLEKSLIATASEVWFVNEPIRRWHSRRYPAATDRLHVVANGYDPDFAPTPRLRESGPEPLRFGYIGTVSRKVPLEQFIAGWAFARRRSSDIAEATAAIWGHLGFHSGTSSSLDSLLERAGAEGVSYGGPLDRDRVREVYEDFDALLLVLGSGDYVTSGKVYEYLASALPIVSVHEPRNAASDVLRGYPLWFPVRDLEPESIAEALTAAAKAARDAGPDVRRACVEFAADLSRDLQLAPRLLALRRLLSDRQS